jgi:NAD-dependent deacetylase
VERARALLERAGTVVVLTGAGVSAESGVPTFRGPGGMWKSHRPEELATPGAFARDPRLVWEWYQWRRDLVGRCVPNPAHHAIASLQTGRDGVTLVTQNVDGLHRVALREADRHPPEEKADSSVRLVLELHGSLFRVKCTRCPWRAERREPVDATSEGSLPRCPECDALVRPDVVWFGESLDADVLEAAFAAAREAEVCLVVGTSGVVQPAASIPWVAREAGGRLIEVNVRESALSAGATVFVRGPAGDVLPRILPDLPRPAPEGSR